MADAPHKPTILAVQGGDREEIQSLLIEAARRLSAAGVCVLGVVEHIVPGGAHHEVVLRDLVTGEIYQLHQNLGPGSGGCSLDLDGLACACAGVETAIAARLAAGGTAADTVVILSKYGREEAEGRGFLTAFYAAVAAEFSVLTSLSPSVEEEWAGFVGDMARVGKANLDEVETWWREPPLAKAG